jgi:uncharacterized membrane protein YgdD (TMEM256/DUF423 family)
MIAKVIASGALLMALAIAAGAFGAHALKDRLDEYSKGVYDKAAFYHLIHAIAILIVGLIASNKLISEYATEKIVFLFLGGIAIFSGSLYLLALTGVRWLGAITPIGGTLFIVAWLYLAYSAYLNR